MLLRRDDELPSASEGNQYAYHTTVAHSNRQGLSHSRRLRPEATYARGSRNRTPTAVHGLHSQAAHGSKCGGKCVVAVDNRQTSVWAFAEFGKLPITYK